MNLLAIMLLLAAIIGGKAEAIIGCEAATICQWPSVVDLDQDDRNY